MQSNFQAITCTFTGIRNNGKRKLGKILDSSAQYPPVTWETVPSDVQQVPCMNLLVLISNFYQTEGLTVDE